MTYVRREEMPRLVERMFDPDRCTIKYYHTLSDDELRVEKMFIERNIAAFTAHGDYEATRLREINGVIQRKADHLKRKVMKNTVTANTGSK